MKLQNIFWPVAAVLMAAALIALMWNLPVVYDGPRRVTITNYVTVTNRCEPMIFSTYVISTSPQMITCQVYGVFADVTNENGHFSGGLGNETAISNLPARGGSIFSNSGFVPIEKP